MTLAEAGRVECVNARLDPHGPSFLWSGVHPSPGRRQRANFPLHDQRHLAPRWRDSCPSYPAPLILPVFAVISESAHRRHEYGQALEVLSKPLMREFGNSGRFAQEVQYEDGVRSNLRFDQWEEALPTWRYPDFTLQASYLGKVLDASITEGLRAVAHYLSRYDKAENALKRLVEGSSGDYARIIRSITKHRSVSGKLKKTYPLVFEEPGRSDRIVTGILHAFDATDLDGDDENLIHL